MEDTAEGGNGRGFPALLNRKLLYKAAGRLCRELRRPARPLPMMY